MQKISLTCQEPSQCSPQQWPVRAARLHASPDHWLVMGSLGFQRYSQGRPRCRIRARRGQGSDSPGRVYAVQRTESVAASYLSIPATTAAAVGQRASGGAANGATVVDESVRQLKVIPSSTRYARPLCAFELAELPGAKVAVGACTLLRPRTIAPKLESLG
jgi:hypothetical protein